MNIRKQRGLTLMGFGLVLVLVVFFAYAAMRVVPVYLEYQALVNSMNVLKADPRGARMSRRSIEIKLMDSLWVNYATDNIQKKHIRVTRKDGLQVRVAYEVRKDFVGNIDLILSFERTVQLK
ncbi:MAG: DUF4845 domain-containing protein [Proteobacteria bacterium]|nr:DUF4845 domain-containing protein [Pseudomonadota bacterium]